MARVSKKVSAAQREAENAPHRVWKTAIYARLSDFDDVFRNTESLEVQISYIKEYINHRDDLMLLDVFADKRCTGMNFDRPEFERLLKALQERKIDCIVVKDFSRLGRNFVETGQYLEQVFPLFGVRFIAINDNYDSLNRQSRDGMLVPIKSMINEMYSKDLSQKIQSCFRSKEARGEIYTPVPFGYKRNQQNHLILDAESFDSGRGSQRCGSSDFSLEEIRHERARDCKEAVCAGNPNTFYTPLSAGIPEKHFAGKGPSMADRVRDKGAGKSNLHRNNGL